VGGLRRRDLNDRRGPQIVPGQPIPTPGSTLRLDQCHRQGGAPARVIGAIISDLTEEGRAANIQWVKGRAGNERADQLARVAPEKSSWSLFTSPKVSETAWHDDPGTMATGRSPHRQPRSPADWTASETALPESRRKSAPTIGDQLFPEEDKEKAG
jgi:hypothetical protein